MSSRGHARVDGGGTAPRLQVQRSLSRDTITIHFSALSGEDGEDEEELYSLTALPCSSSHQQKHGCQNATTADEPGKKLSLKGSGSVATVVTPPSAAPVPSLPTSTMTTSSPTLASVSSSLLSSSSWPLEQKAPPTDHIAALSGPAPPRPAPLPSKPFLSLVRSLSTEAEGAPPPRFHRQLVKTLVKSLSMDTSQGDPETVQQNQPDSDSKTAPSSPQTVPSLLEAEGCFEDSQQRLSDIMSEPLQLLNRMRTDEGTAGSAPCRLRTLSSSVQEISLNARAENGFMPVEKQDAADGQGRLGLVLDRCSMSALARQQLRELQHLYSQDARTDAGIELDWRVDTTQATSHKARIKVEVQDKEEVRVTPSRIPHKFLFTLAVLVYGCFVLPLPPYLGGALLGVAAGFILAAFMVWMAAHSHPQGCGQKGGVWKVASLDIQEPGIFKGWMNEIHDYDPEMYHATLTHSVFVRLEGSTLRLSKPNRNIARRAAFNEPKPDVTYISQRIYDLTDSKIYLMPKNLARKRVWNKKYPICVELGSQEAFMSKAQSNRGELGPGDAQGASASGEQTLHLFGRTGREKEEWFRRMSVASQLKSEAKKLPSIPLSFMPTHSRSSSSGQAGAPTHSRSSSQSSVDDILGSQAQQRELMGSQRQKALLDYSVYMAQYIPSPPSSPSPSSVHSSDVSPGASKKLPDSPVEVVEPEAWVNALLGRILWDFLGEKYWADLVSRKAQMKLSKIRLPYFMNELTLTELDMGITIPKILKASAPTIDHQGLWVDLDISYNGSFLMTLETKMNLARLGKDAEGIRLGELGKDGSRPRTYCLADSDEESSSAGSSDEEDPPEIHSDKSLPPGPEGHIGGHRPSKIMRFVDKIAKSKYFQKATETEFIKKKMEEVSNTPLLLTVEVQELQGTLSVNIPPPPTDRIWYGFKTPPHLVLKARPKLGEREVTLAHVTDWIEKKLDQEFQKIFVMPNMDDIWLPIMHSATDTRSTVSMVTRTAEDSKEPIAKEPSALASTVG